MDLCLVVVFVWTDMMGANFSQFFQIWWGKYRGSKWSACPAASITSGLSLYLYGVYNNFFYMCFILSHLHAALVSDGHCDDLNLVSLIVISCSSCWRTTLSLLWKMSWRRSRRCCFQITQRVRWRKRCCWGARVKNTRTERHWWSSPCISWGKWNRTAWLTICRTVSKMSLISKCDRSLQSFISVFMDEQLTEIAHCTIFDLFGCNYLKIQFLNHIPILSFI